MAATPQTVEALTRAPQRGWWSGIAGFCRQRPLGAVGAVIVVLIVVLGAAAGWLAPYDPLANDYGTMRTGSAPMRSAATCSRASSSARAPR